MAEGVTCFDGCAPNTAKLSYGFGDCLSNVVADLCHNLAEESLREPFKLVNEQSSLMCFGAIVSYKTVNHFAKCSRKQRSLSSNFGKIVIFRVAGDVKRRGRSHG